MLGGCCQHSPQPPPPAAAPRVPLPSTVPAPSLPKGGPQSLLGGGLMLETCAHLHSPSLWRAWRGPGCIPPPAGPAAPAAGPVAPHSGTSAPPLRTPCGPPRASPPAPPAAGAIPWSSPSPAPSRVSAPAPAAAPRAAHRPHPPRSPGGERTEGPRGPFPEPGRLPSNPGSGRQLRPSPAPSTPTLGPCAGGCGGAGGRGEEPLAAGKP